MSKIKIDVGKKTHKGKVRENNEDSLLVHKYLFAVADGIGGHAAGEMASKIAVTTLEESFSTNKKVSGVKEFLAEAINHANKRIFDASASNQDYNGMGTTLTALVIPDSEYFIGHIGDSRAYLVRGGKIMQLTSDHSFVAEQVRAGLITPEEAITHPQKHIITRALGTERNVEVDAFQGPIKKGDAFVLCTDGLTDLVGDGEIEKAVLSNPPQKACDALVDLANERGGRDNITVIITHVRKVSNGL